jgi:hypothetical protein
VLEVFNDKLVDQAPIVNGRARLTATSYGVWTAATR